MTIAPALIAVVVLSAPLAAQAQTAGNTQARAQGSIAIRSGGVEVMLSPADLAKLPRQERPVGSAEAGDGATVSGILLWDLLERAGVVSAQASGRQRAVMYVKLTGADGQSAVLALVEVDPSFSRRAVIVADRRDGKALDNAEGPWRVFVQDDLRHARWIRGLVDIEVGVIK